MNAKNPQQRYARTVRLLQVVLLLLIFAVLGTAGVALMSGPRLFFPPTPTFTPTAGPRLTATPDFRTTLIAEDVATQDAYATLVVASGGRLSPLGLPTTPTRVVVAPAVTPTATVGIDEVTPLPVDQLPIDPTDDVSVSLLPLVNGGQPFPGVPPTETIFPGGVPTDTLATPLPPEFVPTETPTPTFTPPLPTDTPTPTPTLFFVPNLLAVVTSSPGATAYAGPGSLYAVIGSVNFNENLTLLNRDETGEWVYSCCVASQSYWIRQANAPPRNNQLQNGAPPNATPNDVRWLQVLQAPAAANPILTPTPVVQDSYPFYRYVRGNNSRVPNLPQPPFQNDWPSPFGAAAPMNSAVIVAGGFVMVGNQDNHLYGLDRTFGNQQWAYNLSQPMFNAPVAQDNLIYLVNNTGAVIALNIVGNQAQPLWTTAAGTPLSSLYLAGNRLFLVIQEGADARRVVTLDRTNGQLLVERYTGTAQLTPHLAVGNQSLYVGDPTLRAIDINKFDLVWQQPEVPSLSSSPLYVTNGPIALAELYVADAANIVYLLNANTGQIVWRFNNGVAVTGMAVSDENLYIASGSKLQVVARRTGSSLWSVDVPGTILGGPIVDADQVLVVTNNGSIRMFNSSGAQLDASSLPNGAQATGAPAVSGLYLYIPGNNGTVHALRGLP